GFLQDLPVNAVEDGPEFVGRRVGTRVELRHAAAAVAGQERIRDELFVLGPFAANAFQRQPVLAEHEVPDLPGDVGDAFARLPVPVGGGDGVEQSRGVGGGEGDLVGG